MVAAKPDPCWESSPLYEVPHSHFDGYCERCETALQDSIGNAYNYAGVLCRDCCEELWQKAASYGGKPAEIELRVVSLMHGFTGRVMAEDGEY